MPKDIHYTRWSRKMEQYLTKHYQKNGDKKLSEMFEARFPKHFKWTLKHIEKKRMYLNLIRTPEQIWQIKSKNSKAQDHIKNWDTRGRAAEGEIRIWKGRKYIKHNGQFILYHRHLVNAKPDQVVRVHEGQIKIIDREENCRLNNKQRHALPRELKKTITALNQLKKIINGQKN